MEGFAQAARPVEGSVLLGSVAVALPDLSISVGLGVSVSIVVAPPPVFLAIVAPVTAAVFPTLLLAIVPIGCDDARQGRCQRRNQ
jgi:hypothetical protein